MFSHSSCLSSSKPVAIDLHGTAVNRRLSHFNLSLVGIFQADASTAHMWYRRTFTVPSDWAGSRILLHFGAVDWQATVTVNGQRLGVHKGG